MLGNWFGEKTDCVYGKLVKIPLSTFTYPNNATSADKMAAFFSCMPIVILVAILIYGVIKHDAHFFVFLFGFLMHWPVTGILKAIIQQSRPLGTCNSSYGMPSGHSFVATSVFVILTLLVLNNVFKLKSQRLAMLKISLIPISACLLLPVPWARVQLYDHSEAQAFIGGALGAIWGVIWHRFQLPISSILSTLSKPL
jgi:membrane-associated phospholipid phosphatase